MKRLCVSACLLGVPCRWKGDAKPCEAVQRLVARAVVRALDPATRRALGESHAESAEVVSHAESAENAEVVSHAENAEAAEVVSHAEAAETAEFRFFTLHFFTLHFQLLAVNC